MSIFKAENPAFILEKIKSIDDFAHEINEFLKLLCNMPKKYNPLSNMTKKQVSNLWRIKEYPKYFRKI